MSSLVDKWQARLMPIANKIGNQKFLVALRDSFIGTMPVIMTGSFALMVNAFLSDLPGQFGWTWISSTFQWLIDICLLYTSPSPRDKRQSRMPSSA